MRRPANVHALLSHALAQASAAAESAHAAALKLASDAASGVDGLVGELTSKAAALKREAGGSSKAAGAALDGMVASAISQGQALKESLGGLAPDAAAQVDAALGKFVATANGLRGQLNSQQLGAGRVLDEVRRDGRGRAQGAEPRAVHSTAQEPRRDERCAPSRTPACMHARKEHG